MIFPLTISTVITDSTVGAFNNLKALHSTLRILLEKKKMKNTQFLNLPA